MDQTLEVYIKLRDRLLTYALPIGFEIKEEHREDSFGSHYITLIKNEKAIRLIWDGRDYMFELEINEAVDKNSFKGWHYLVNKMVSRPPWNQDVIDEVFESIEHEIEKLNF